MTDLIDEIINAEQSAKEIISKAKAEAETLSEENLRKCEAVVKESAENARQDKKDSLAMAYQKAEEDAYNFLSEQKKRLDYLKEKCQKKEKDLADEIVGRIKNWQ